MTFDGDAVDVDRPAGGRGDGVATAPLIVSEPAPIVELVALMPVPLVVSMSSVPPEKVTLAPVPAVLVKVRPLSVPVFRVTSPVKSILPPRIVDEADAAAAAVDGDGAGEADRAAAVAGDVDHLVAAASSWSPMAATVTAPVPPLMLTPSPAGSLVAPIVPPLMFTALVAPTMLTPAPPTPSMLTVVKVTAPVVFGVVPLISMPSPAVLSIVALAKLKVELEAVMLMPSAPAPPVPPMVTAPPLNVPAPAASRLLMLIALPAATVPLVRVWKAIPLVPIVPLEIHDLAGAGGDRCWPRR